MSMLDPSLEEFQMEPCHGSMAHFPAVNFHGLAIPVFEVLEFLRVLVELGDDVVFIGDDRASAFPGSD